MDAGRRGGDIASPGGEGVQMKDESARCIEGQCDHTHTEEVH